MHRYKFLALPGASRFERCVAWVSNRPLLFVTLVFATSLILGKIANELGVERLPTATIIFVVVVVTATLIVWLIGRRGYVVDVPKRIYSQLHRRLVDAQFTGNYKLAERLFETHLIAELLPKDGTKCAPSEAAIDSLLTRLFGPNKPK